MVDFLGQLFPMYIFVILSNSVFLPRTFPWFSLFCPVSSHSRHDLVPFHHSKGKMLPPNSFHIGYANGPPMSVGWKFAFAQRFLPRVVGLQQILDRVAAFTTLQAINVGKFCTATFQRLVLVLLEQQTTLTMHENSDDVLDVSKHNYGLQNAQFNQSATIPLEPLARFCVELVTM